MLPRSQQYNPGFLAARIIRVSELEVILVAHYSTQEAMDDVSKNIAGPWFAEHVRPYPGGPVDRQVGEVILDF